MSQDFDEFVNKHPDKQRNPHLSFNAEFSLAYQKPQILQHQNSPNSSKASNIEALFGVPISGREKRKRRMGREIEHTRSHIRVAPFLSAIGCAIGDVSL
jgi:hypothetical protein